jgi:CheY-like chemotaxis protein
VYGIVQQHKGFIRVGSEPGLGSTFSIYLPRADEAVRATEDPEPAAPRPASRSLRGTEAILLVEDQDELREVALEALTLSGYRVRDAGTVGEALRLAGDHPDRIDLLLTDVVMPDLNGRELAERILALHPEARVLFMSGYTDDAIVHHGVLDPGTAFLPKPFTPTDLARKVREVLDAPASQPAPGA